jgi:hypothetical protein
LERLSDKLDDVLILLVLAFFVMLGECLEKIDEELMSFMHDKRFLDSLRIVEMSEVKPVEDGHLLS